MLDLGDEVIAGDMNHSRKTRRRRYRIGFLIEFLIEFLTEFCVGFRINYLPVMASQGHLVAKSLLRF